MNKQVKHRAQKLLDEKINDVFFELQEDLGIEYGDIYPLQAVKLDELIENLAELIADVIESELDIQVEY